MIHSNLTSRRTSGNSQALIVLAVWAAFSVSVLAGDTNSMANMPGMSGNPNTSDLTGLSLNELYNLNVVKLNVLGGHTHCAGQLMFGYDYTHTHMAGLYEGTHQISDAQAFAEGFGVVHTSMDMNMHMGDVMYAPSDYVTLMAMMPYMQMTMNHLTSSGTRFTQHTGGIGDADAMALFTVYGNSCDGGNRIVLNAGVSFPTGAIDAKDHKDGNSAEPEVQLEYLMQQGSGTYDWLPGVTYLGESENWSWGARTLETIRFGRNYHDYRLGNEYGGSGWVAYAFKDWFAPSFRVNGKIWDNIHGADPALAANPTPEGRPNLRAGSRIDALFGLNLYAPKGVLTGNRLSVEGGLPIYQDLKGPQLGTAWMISLRWSYEF